MLFLNPDLTNFDPSLDYLFWNLVLDVNASPNLLPGFWFAILKIFSVARIFSFSSLICVDYPLAMKY